MPTTRTAPPDAHRAHADGLAAIAGAAEEVTRLDTLVSAASHAVQMAEAHAADVVAAPDASDATTDAAMIAVSTAQARHRAALAALERAHVAESSARAALVPLERQVRRADAERALEALAPALQDIDAAIALLAGALPIVEAGYHTGTRALLDARDPSGRDPFHTPTAPPLVLAGRIRSLLFHRIGTPVFDGLPGTVDLMAPGDTIASRVSELVAAVRRVAETPHA